MNAPLANKKGVSVVATTAPAHDRKALDMNPANCPCPRQIDTLKRTIAKKQRMIAELKGRLKERELALGELRRLLKDVMTGASLAPVNGG